MARLHRCVRRLPLAAALLLLLTALAACSSGSGKVGAVNPPPEQQTEEDAKVLYRGPLAHSVEANHFQTRFWTNVAAESRCGGCHVQDKQSPQFARSDDINLAYSAALSVVAINDPASSRLVRKVAGGHGCWSVNTGFCEEKLVEWITAWATDAGVELTETALRVPPVREVSPSLRFPELTAEFAQTVYPLLTDYCKDCHRGEALQTPVQPYFASSNVAEAYAASQSKMRFNVGSDASIDASGSRLVERLREEAHNCWGGSCNASADTMEAALEVFAATMELRPVDASLVTSKALAIGDGTAISQGGRIETNAIAVYPFKAGKGDIASDYAEGFPPAADLKLYGDVEWVSNWGVRINNGRVQAATSTSAKLARYIKQTGEYALEAWLVPANVSQEGPARIVSYSGSDTERNFTLGQTLYSYNAANRSSETNANGGPLVSTADADEVLQATLQHVVVSFDGFTGRKIYVNGELVAQEEGAGGGLNAWDDTFALVLGNETSGMYPWRGTIRFLAIHNRAFTAEQVATNFAVGVGQKILVAFSVGHLIDDMSDAYIVLQVEQFDDYSYLFSQPFFFSFTETPISDIRIEGLRIGVNGREAAIGQVFGNLNTTISARDYQQEGVPLSNLGAVIELEKGPEQDQFFLSFDRIGNHHNQREPMPSAPPPTAEDLAQPQPRMGVRVFDEINATLSALTKIPVTDPAVSAAYRAVEQQMPAKEHPLGFTVAQHMGITQLAVKYCDVLASDQGLRAHYFPMFTDRFDSPGRDAIIDPLLKALLAHHIEGAGAQLSNQPLVDDSRLRLNELIDTMTTSCNNDMCSPSITSNIITAACAAAFGSAIMLIQ